MAQDDRSTMSLSARERGSKHPHPGARGRTVGRSPHESVDRNGLCDRRQTRQLVALRTRAWIETSSHSHVVSKAESLSARERGSKLVKAGIDEGRPASLSARERGSK